MSNNKVFVRFPGENCKRTTAPSIQTRVRDTGVKGFFEISLYHPNYNEPEGQKKVLHREVVEAKNEREANSLLKEVVLKNFKTFKTMDDVENDRAKKDHEDKLEKGRNVGRFVKIPALEKTDIEMSVHMVELNRYEIQALHSRKIEAKDQRKILQKQIIQAKDLNEAFAVANSIKKSDFKHINTVYEKPMPEQAKRAKERSKNSKKAA